MNQEILNIMATRQRCDLAINSLKGILQGINLDGAVNDKELEELSNWVRNNDALIDRNPFNEFMALIDETIREGKVDGETIEDLFWLCQKYEADNIFYKGLTTDLQILQGICHGILSDGIINDAEIFGIKQWIESHKHLRNHYPYDELHTLLLDITADKHIDDQERNILKAYFNQFVNIVTPERKTEIESEIAGITIDSVCSSEYSITIPGSNFCLTGIMQRYSRRDLEKDIERLGGSVKKTVSSSTNYLIVGDNGNPAWAFSCYGRKVELAMNLRKQGHGIAIIHEYSFCDVLDELR